ncbi:Uncharacterized protein APZ42_014277 [Daphnia magna]|uniref:Uncharacterized protein n=1 Tax=Daphnia magna TaxID=35525 RepID=A0A162Q6F5_9CRUS|nr:Uncharacterized protein APZ42_014277 [Daphnia magna]
MGEKKKTTQQPKPFCLNNIYLLRNKHYAASAIIGAKNKNSKVAS